MARGRRRQGLALVAVLALAAAVGVVAGVTIALARPPGRASHRVSGLHGLVAWRPGQKRAPAFSLRDEAGRRLSLRSQRGRVVLLAFLDSRCRSACPVDGHQLGQVQRALRGRRFELLAVTVDPWADTPRSARAFAAHAHWRGHWHWLLGTPHELRPVWRAYRIAVLRARDIVHTRSVYLIDPSGNLRTVYLLPLEPGAVARDARALGRAA
jgi:cytochrome oxidase Cu insertion factor (SCO1/SenC/PrrC family)